MQYSFDQEISRRNTDCIKWEFYVKDREMLEWGDEDCFRANRVLPLWVADMDFPCPKPVIDALVERANHGFSGDTKVCTS